MPSQGRHGDETRRPFSLSGTAYQLESLSLMVKFDPVYASPGGTPLRYDLLRPETDAKTPLIVFIHGGGWISGDKSDLQEIACSFVERGYAAALIQYRLAPLHPFPSAVEDVQSFVRFIRAQAGEFGIDAGRIASLGSSAGAHLALMLGVTDVAEDGISSRVQTVIDLCGITDLTNYRETHYPIAWSFLEQFVPLPYEGNEQVFRSASPLTLVDQHAAPTLIVHGEEDDIVPIGQSEALAAAMSAHKVAHRFLRVPSEGHGFSLEAWPAVEQAIVDFLQEHL